MISFVKKIFSISKEYLLLSILLVVSLMLLSFNSGEKINQFKIISFGSFAVVNNLISAFTDGFVTKSKFEAGLKQNANLMLENTLLRSRAAKASKLESLLGLKEIYSHELLACRIISKNGSLFDGRVIIDVGSEDGVEEGLPLIDNNGLIGLVAGVHANYSLVKQLYNNELKIAVTLTTTNTEGILAWNGSDLVIQNVPTTKSIGIGDEVTTSSFSSIFPPLIPIGNVQRVESSVAGLLSDVVIKPYSDIEAASTAFILLVNEESMFRDSTAKAGN